ncbi:hypothetical protein SNE40_000993 [Patella caerulea]|uniref:Uncharacterized protein n=1 Tax=Patella caerulea TaxID=87958 RepID=A0AAN8QAP3_PATCE
MENRMDEASNTTNGTQFQQQSLLSALYKFVQAVKNMDEAVMIPSKLRDMEVVESTGVLSEENNNKALVPCIPAGSDLYSFYSMLNAVKHEIISGPARDGEFCELEDNADDSSKKTAAAFRHHLQGIFGLLHQLTETANFLSHRYEGEVTQNSGSISPFGL